LDWTKIPIHVNNEKTTILDRLLGILVRRKEHGAAHIIMSKKRVSAYFLETLPSRFPDLKVELVTEI